MSFSNKYQVKTKAYTDSLKHTSGASSVFLAQADKVGALCALKDKNDSDIIKDLDFSTTPVTLFVAFNAKSLSKSSFIFVLKVLRSTLSVDAGVRGANLINSASLRAYLSADMVNGVGLSPFGGLPYVSVKFESVKAMFRFLNNPGKPYKSFDQDSLSVWLSLIPSGVPTFVAARGSWLDFAFLRDYYYKFVRGIRINSNLKVFSISTSFSNNLPSVVSGISFSCFSLPRLFLPLLQVHVRLLQGVLFACTKTDI